MESQAMAIFAVGVFLQNEENNQNYYKSKPNLLA